MNKVIIMGNLGKDPETFKSNGGAQKVISFSVATTEKFTDKSGNTKENTEWHRIVAFGKIGEACEKYLARGCKCLVEGKLRTRKLTKDGIDRWTTEIIAENVRFLSMRKEKEESKVIDTQAIEYEDIEIPF